MRSASASSAERNRSLLFLQEEREREKERKRERRSGKKLVSSSHFCFLPNFFFCFLLFLMSSTSSSSAAAGGAKLKFTRGKAIATGAAFCCGAFAYEAYRRGWFTKTQKALTKIVDSAQDTAETLQTLAKDTRDFLSSDSEVVPQSLRQAIKLASCSETKEAVQTHVQATIQGVLGKQQQKKGQQNEKSYNVDDLPFQSDSDMSEREVSSQGTSTSTGSERETGGMKKSNSMLTMAMEKVFSKKGSGFFSMVAASVARQTITTLMESASEQTNDGEAFEKYKDLLVSEEGKQFISDLLVTLVVESTSVYIDKTIHINTYDQILETAIKPQHKSFVENLCVKLCKVWTETVMVPAPPPPQHQQQAAAHTNLGNLSHRPPEADLCTPREYPELIPEGACSPNNCESPKSVCSGIRGSSSAATSEQTDIEYIANHQAASRSELLVNHQNLLSRQQAQQQQPQPNMVKDILTSAASDANVRSFLVNVASSSSAATARVVLEAFVPSWMMTRRKSVNGNGHVAHANGMDTKKSLETQQQRVYLFAFLFLVAALLVYRLELLDSEVWTALSTLT